MRFLRVLKFNHNHSPVNGQFISGRAMGKPLDVQVPGFLLRNSTQRQINFARALHGARTNVPGLFKAKKYNHNHVPSGPHGGEFTSNPNPISVDQQKLLRDLSHGIEPFDKELPPGVHVIDREAPPEKYMSWRKLLGLKPKKPETDSQRRERLLDARFGKNRRDNRASMFDHAANVTADAADRGIAAFEGTVSRAAAALRAKPPADSLDWYSPRDPSFWDGKARKFQSILKFNPYHDPKDGEFTTADAVGALNVGKKINLSSQQLPGVLQAMADDSGQNPNLMHATVDGKDVFSRGNTGLDRIQMPQVPGPLQHDFLNSLHAKVELVQLDPAQLKPTQGQLDGHKVGKIFYDLQRDGKVWNKPILVSRDNYVLDGHHFWAASRAARLYNKSTTVPAYRIDMSQKQLMAAAQRFTDQAGVPRKDIAKAAQSIAQILRTRKYNENHDPANGQFTFANAGATYDQRAAQVQGLFDQYGVDAIVPKTNQAEADPHALYAQAQEAHQEMDELLDQDKGIATQLGYKKMDVPPEKAPLDDPGGMLFIAPLKNFDTAAAKVKNEYNGDWSKLLDVTRSTIAVDNMSELRSVIAKLKDSGVKFTRIKDRFAKPTNGYRDVLMNLEFSNGHIGELQLHVKSMLKAKNTGHLYYENQRSISHKYPAGTPIFSYSEPDRRAYGKEVLSQRDLYTHAWEHTPK